MKNQKLYLLENLQKIIPLILVDFSSSIEPTSEKVVSDEVVEEIEKPIFSNVSSSSGIGEETIEDSHEDLNAILQSTIVKLQ